MEFLSGGEGRASRLRPAFIQVIVVVAGVGGQFPRADVQDGGGDGLDEMDKRILLTIIEKYSGGPVGVNTIAVAVGEESGTIEEVYEPFLIRQGFINRTPRGRTATDLSYIHFGFKNK